MRSAVFFKIFVPILLLVIIEIIVVSKISSSVNDTDLHMDVVDTATKTIKQYQVIRKYYNENIISKVSTKTDLKIDTNHKTDPKTIPLPATFMHDLGELMSEKLDGMQIRLYSDYPYPNRKGNVLDDFASKSIKHFRSSDSQELFESREMIKGVEVIRVSVADKMTSMTCVNCHNTRIDSPKKDWKLGDVRGVLEVIVPITKHAAASASITNYINTAVIISSLILLSIIFFIISYYSKLEQRQAYKLAQERYKLNKTVNAFGTNVIASTTDINGIITNVTQALCTISGYTKEELIGHPHNILRHPDMSSEVFKEMWKEIRSGHTWEGEVKNKKKEDGFYWVRTTVFPEYDYENKLVGYSSIRHDITSQKVKEEFFSNMSHELRTPLNAIMGFVGILNKQIVDKEHKEYLGYISSSSQQLLDLINDILDLSKIKNGEFSIETHKFNAYKELTKYAHSFDGIISNKDITFTTTVSHHLNGVFLGDWLRISQIILNLVSNAVKFTPADGTIKFEVDYLDGNMILSIEDDGIGMSKETQDKIFKPFIQADKSTSRKYGGTGLGLSITQSLIELMHGKLELQSQEKKGSKFTVTIPMEKFSSDIAVVQDDIYKDKREELHGHVLVAEDNKTNQILIKLLLEEQGLTCDVANDGQEALDMYDPGVYNLILMDENMPNMNGITSMNHIKERYAERCGPIVALTANVMEGDKEHFLSAGMDGYIAKPIDEDELYNVLKEFLA